MSIAGKRAVTFSSHPFHQFCAINNLHILPTLHEDQPDKYTTVFSDSLYTEKFYARLDFWYPSASKSVLF